MSQILTELIDVSIESSCCGKKIGKKNSGRGWLVSEEGINYKWLLEGQRQSVSYLFNFAGNKASAQIMLVAFC